MLIPPLVALLALVDAEIEINLSIMKKYFIVTSSMIASITRLRILKSYVGLKSHEKSQTVSARKLHNIVQSIEFYWLNSPLNQLQILYIERFAMRGIE